MKDFAQMFNYTQRWSSVGGREQTGTKTTVNTEDNNTEQPRAPSDPLQRFVKLFNFHYQNKDILLLHQHDCMYLPLYPSNAAITLALSHERFEVAEQEKVDPLLHGWPPSQRDS